MNDSNLLGLSEAIHESNMEVFNNFVEMHPNILDTCYYVSDMKLSPFLDTILSGNKEMCEILLKYVLEINKKDCLHVGCYFSQDVSSSVQPQLEMTALNHAASLGNKDIVDLLLKAKLNVNDFSLHFALFVEPESFYKYKKNNWITIPKDPEDVVNYKREIVNMLLNAGADPSKIICSYALVESCQFQKFDSKNQFQMLAYAFDSGIAYGADIKFWQKGLLKIIEREYLNPESRWFGLYNLEKRFFPSVDDFSIVEDEDKIFFEQIQSAKEEIKKKATASLIQRTGLDFNNETIAERYRTIAQRMLTEYKDPVIEDALGKIDVKMFGSTQVLPEDIDHQGLEVLEKGELRQKVTKFLSLNDAKSLKAAFDKQVNASNMDISPRFSPEQKQEDEKSFAQREEKRRKLDPSSPSNKDL